MRILKNISTAMFFACIPLGSIPALYLITYIGRFSILSNIFGFNVKFAFFAMATLGLVCLGVTVRNFAKQMYLRNDSSADSTIGAKRGFVAGIMLSLSGFCLQRASLYYVFWLTEQ